MLGEDDPRGVAIYTIVGRGTMHGPLDLLSRRQPSYSLPVRRCSSCARHLLPDTNACPFCGAADRVTHWAPVLGAMVGLSLLIGCGDSADGEGSGEGTAPGTTGASESGSTDAMTTATTAATTGATATTQPTTTDMTTTTVDPDSGSTGSTGSTGDEDSTDGTTMGSSTDDGTTSSTTTDDSMDTAIPPYAGVWPDPADETEPSPESTTG